MIWVRFEYDGEAFWGNWESDTVTKSRKSMKEFLSGASPEWDESLDVRCVRLLPPVEAESQVICVARNYPAHVKEMRRDNPERPLFFFKPYGSLVGFDSPLVMPEHSAFFDYEGELAIVIGKQARNVSVESAMEYVGGYTVMNDGSCRDLFQVTNGDSSFLDWFSAKAQDQSTSLGPVVVPANQIPDPSSLRITTRLNGEVVQDSYCDEMLFSIPELIAHATRVVTLRPGDVIATGTPAGVGKARGRPLSEGDSIEVTVDPIPTLRNRVAAVAASEITS